MWVVVGMFRGEFSNCNRIMKIQGFIVGKNVGKCEIENWL